MNSKIIANLIKILKINYRLKISNIQKPKKNILYLIKNKKFMKRFHKKYNLVQIKLNQTKIY